MRALVLLLCACTMLAAGDDPKIIIIGSGSAGIAAASKLLQNGLTDVTILEAEKEIGGRINSTKFEDYVIDLGAQWVHGEKDNSAYELASPLGLLSKSHGPGELDMKELMFKVHGSSGVQLPVDVSTNLFEFARHNLTFEKIEELKTGSLGEVMVKRLNKYYETNGISPDIWEPLTNALHVALMVMKGAEDWNDVSLNGTLEYIRNEGFQKNNWKERSYSTVLDVLMKKIPTPSEELPIANKTLLNKKVVKISYGGDGPVKLTTADGDEYTADHVICTVSLGVLKAHHQQLFDPPLPEKNRNSIENLGFGQNVKIFLYYDEPWWTNDIDVESFIWTDEDRKEIENDPERNWMLGIAYAFGIEWKPNLLFLWMSGPYCENMEKVSDELFKNETLHFIQKFFGSSHNVTQPKNIIRSFWNTNDNFRGSHSYRSLASDANHASAKDLGSPVMRNDKPILQFAGEATEPSYYASVHGAITSGWREAERLIDYNKKKL